MKCVVVAYMSLDGVVQAPNRPGEDPDGGFAHGGWSHPFYDPEIMGPVFGEAMQGAAALLFGALLSGTSQRNLDPTIFEPELASNLTLIIQGLVVLIVSADVIVLTMLRGGRGLFRRRQPAPPAPAQEAEAA